MSLTQEQIDIIKATVPVVQEHGTSITTVFYDNMLREHPELKAVFNQAHQATGHQARALAGALYAYAANIDNLEALGPAVKLITHKHASLYIKPADYDIVGEYLLAAMKQVLGDACTPAILGAWEAAYWQLAHILIGEEAKLYQQGEDWNDWRRFRIARKIRESDEIISFYLEPADEKRPLPSFRPGQYISVRVFVPGLEHAQARQYSLSDAPRSDYYRISVKKESGLDIAKEGAEKHPGYVSNILHDNKEENDIVEVSHPYGDFFLTSEVVSHPVVLLSAGVGITPMISILNTLTAQSQSHPQRRIHFIHGARRDSGRAFQEHIQHTVAQHPDVKATFFNTSPAQHEQKGVHYHYVGRADLQKLDEKADLFINNAHAEYYICGPEGFMTNTFKALCQRGVDPSRIKMELFGTGGVPKDVLTTEKRMKVNPRLNPVPWALPALIATVGVGLGISFYRKHADQISLVSAFGLWSVTVGAAVMVFTPTMRS